LAHQAAAVTQELPCLYSAELMFEAGSAQAN
jgi:hypothetical protein